MAAVEVVGVFEAMVAVAATRHPSTRPLLRVSVEPARRRQLLQRRPHRVAGGSQEAAAATAASDIKKGLEEQPFMRANMARP